MATNFYSLGIQFTPKVAYEVLIRIMLKAEVIGMEMELLVAYYNTSQPFITVIGERESISVKVQEECREAQVILPGYWD